MIWLEKHINLFLKINGILMLLILAFGILAVLCMFGIPHNSISTWTASQWDMANFLWTPTIIYSAIYLLLAVLCFIRIYFVFPLIVLFLIPALHDITINITEIITYGFIYPLPNILGIFRLLTLILSIIGTILWIRKRKRVKS